MEVEEFCQSQRNLRNDDVWCGVEAPFEYIGPQYKAQPRLRVPLCFEHAREMYISLEPAYFEGVIIIQPIGLNQKVTILCKQCGQSFRIEKVGDTFFAKAAQFCPFCGTHCEPAKPDFVQDYYEYLSAAFQGMDQRLLRLLFEQWTDRRQYPRFRDYVQAVLNDYRSQ